MDFNAIPIFIQVVQKGSFSQAARELNMTKSKVSKTIAKLEDELGAKLLYRTTRRVSLSETGARFYNQVLKGMLFFNTAEEAALELQEQAKGHLKINAPMSFGQLHLSPLIPRFLKEYPEIHIELFLDDKHIDLLETGFDLSIRGGHPEDSTYIMRHLCRLKSVLCAAPEYIQAFGEPQTPTELQDFNCVLYSLSQAKNKWKFKTEKAIESVQVSGNLEVNNSEALKNTLLKGVGIGRLPTFIAGPYLKQGDLQQVLASYTMEEQDIYVFYPDKEYLPLKVRLFLDFLVEELGKTTPDWDRF